MFGVLRTSCSFCSMRATICEQRCRHPLPQPPPPPLLLADFVIVSPVTELAKTVLAFALGITRGATVVTYVQNNVHVPPRPKALGPPPPWHMRLVGQEPPGTPKVWLRTGKVVPLL